MAQQIAIEDTVTVGALADKLKLPVSKLIGELMKNGVMVTVNERIDFDTAQIIVSELGIDVDLEKQSTVIPQVVARRQNQSKSSKTVSRPPVVAVMGHVDHGKTSLLDVIRNSQIAKGEAGGITQHISAYQVSHKDRLITFLDTPGHEAFSAIREHGARLTDIAVIVIAADDGVKPQTIEAIRYARSAAAKIIVAISKVDKAGSDPNRVKQQLSEQNILVEEWGGDTVVVEVSAKNNTGIGDLLDMILLVADVEDYRAEIDVPAEGLIIEVHLEQGRGPIAKALVEEGTLRKGNFVVAGTTYAKVRNLEDSNGIAIESAGPSTPVTISGFKTLPEFGDEFNVVKNEKEARLLSAQNESINQKVNSSVGMSSAELLRIINRSNKLQELNIIIRADVQGSLTSVVDSLKSLDTDEVAVRIVGSGVGSLTESDVHLASTSGSIIYGFNVSISSDIKRLAIRDKISLRIYNVIYELIDDVKIELSKLLAPEVIETKNGQLSVKAIFKTTKSEIICGGEVIKGKLSIPSKAFVYRSDKKIAEVEVINLKRGPQDTKEVFEGEMCGVSIKPVGKINIEVGDIVEFFSRETVARKL